MPRCSYPITQTAVITFAETHEWRDLITVANVKTLASALEEHSYSTGNDTGITEPETGSDGVLFRLSSVACEVATDSSLQHRHVCLAEILSLERGQSALGVIALSHQTKGIVLNFGRRAIAS